MGDMVELADTTTLKVVDENREGASPSIPTNHPVYKSPLWKVYGPYERNQDYRKHIIAYDGINKITISYGKYLMECKLQRILTTVEEVHHKNKKQSDYSLDNLEILQGHEHRTLHGNKWNREEIFKCNRCSKDIKLHGEKLRRLYSERKRGKNKKIFCSKSCLGNGK